MRKKMLFMFSYILIISLFVSSSLYAETYSSTTGGTHALELTNGSASYNNITVTKTGDVSGQSDDYDWQGTNAAVHVSGGGTLTIRGSSTTITSNASYGNALFSYGGNLNGNNSGNGTTINISDATITTSSNNSGGIMATGGGIINARNLTINTSGGSSAAIRSDKGGGTITLSGGTYTTSGQGSPAIYSTAEIIGSDVTLKSNTAQVVVIEGGNSVTLTNSTLTANHNRFNGQDTTYQAILIYQSMSGDASEGSSSFKMTNGSITNTNGDIFHATNTTCTITLSGVTITNNDSLGYFLRASSDSWGTSGSNGGKVTLNASGQTITGNILVDSISLLSMNLSGSSTFNGAINTNGQTGTVSVSLESGSKWILTANSYVSSLTNNGTIVTGSYKLYVNGTEYTDGDNGDDDDDDTIAPTITTASLSSGKTGTSYSETLTASGTSPIAWTISGGTLPNGLSLSTSGVISGTPTRAGTFTFTVKAENSAGSSTKSLSIRIASSGSDSNAPVITTTSLNDATVNRQYNMTLKASGTAPLTWTAENLPDGFTFSSSGVLKGKAIESGTYSIMFTLSNNAGSDSVTLDLKVKDIAPVISAEIKRGAVDVEYSMKFTAKSGTGALTWTLSGELPSGLEFDSDSKDATISGIPTEGCNKKMTITASNSGGTASRTFTLVIKASRPAITTKTLKAGVRGSRYESELGITGTKPLTVTVSGLPEGLEYDNDSGKITGTPETFGKFNVKVTALNSAGKLTKMLKLIVYSSPVIDSVTMHKGTAGKSYIKRFTAQGTKYIKWSVSKGTLPEGMTLLSSSGVLKGKPKSDGTYNFTIKAVNSYGIDSKDISLVIKALAPRIIGAVKRGRTGKEYKSVLKASGTKPIRWSIDGELPDGITFSEGIFSGTPGESFDGTIKVTASNNGGSDSKTYKLVISSSAKRTREFSSSSSSSSSSGTQNEEYISEHNESHEHDVTQSNYHSEREHVYDSKTIEVYKIVAELPELSFDVSGQHDIDVFADESISAGKKLYWFALPQNSEPSSDDEIAEFYDESGKEIDSLPESHKFTVSAWFNEGITYKPVIAVRHEGD